MFFDSINVKCGLLGSRPSILVHLGLLRRQIPLWTVMCLSNGHSTYGNLHSQEDLHSTFGLWIDLELH